MAKKIAYSDEARAFIKSGMDKVAAAVRVSLGPKGRSVILERKYGVPIVIDDGVSIAREVDLEDPFENLGAQLLKEVSARTNDVSGDGTTTATVLAHAILSEGMKVIASGANPTFVKKGIEKAVVAVTDQIKKIAQPVKTKEETAQVATISSNDPEIGNMIADAMEKVGHEGVISVEEGRGAETTVEVVEGMKLERGFISPYFATDPERAECVLTDCMVIVTDLKVFQAQLEMLPFLEKIVQLNKPFLLVVDSLEGEALALTVVNKMQGKLRCAVIKAPGFGEAKKESLTDLATVVGAKVVSADKGLSLTKLTADMIGRADRVIIDKDSTIIVNGDGKKEDIDKRANFIRAQIKEATNEYDRNNLSARLAKLTGGVAVIRVGAATETEMRAKKSKVEDAKNATKAGIEEGLVPGGGVALVRCEHILNSLKGDNEDETIGINIVKKALSAPLKQLIFNAGLDGSVILSDVRKAKEDTYGYNADKMEYCDLIKSGVVDPAKVVRSALQNAASVVGTVLMTECLIVTAPEPKNQNQNEPYPVS